MHSGSIVTLVIGAVSLPSLPHEFQRTISNTIPRAPVSVTSRQEMNHRIGYLPAAIVSPPLRIKMRPISLFAEKGSRGMAGLRAPGPAKAA